ncbi:MAG: HAD hydrolase family protein [Lachnospiraceae bacterium]
MGRKVKSVLPPIGLRIIKSATAVFLCFVVSMLRGDAGFVFYSQLAALWCMQDDIENSKKKAYQRTLGTVIGAIYGLVVIVLFKNLSPGKMLKAVVVSGMIVVIIYTTVLLKKKQASYFSCVVFLSIVVNHISDQNPYLFVFNRFLDTLIGIIVGVAVNSFSLPRRHNQNILFISGLDDTLLSPKANLTDYSRVELNRMIKEGARFTISTMRTPASLMEPLKDIHLELPVIAMDGAVLYDIREKMYLHAYVISYEQSKKIEQFILANHMNCFMNVIIDDMLVIYYQESEQEIYNQLICTLRRSPYRNYVKRELPEHEEVVYFMLIDQNAKIETIYKKMEENGFLREMKVSKYPSKDYPGYSYLKIYNKNATKKNMMDYLRRQLPVEKVVTFGTIPGQYDYIIEQGDSNRVVKIVKELFEPVSFKK